GGRTGLTAVVVAVLFLLALFFSPLIAMVGSYPSITAPALVFVGAMMLRNVVNIDWKDTSESFPAFLIILGIPMTYSIADGIALGLVAHPLIKLFSGRGREVSPLLYILMVLLILYYLLLRAGIG
ncbi:MAG: NCS2 family permease, partial [Candidatus Sumerlaeia bacterium]|nr:NCS2 family permease [Candidatus Sumerlaeia bacterium]